MSVETSGLSSSSMPPVVSPGELRTRLQSDGSIRLLDVRTPAEHGAFHIQGAYNVPVDELAEHSAEIRQLTSPVVLVCQSGVRARRAEAVLRAAGAPQLHVLEGGMQAWRAARLPVVEGRRHVSLERQVRIVAGAMAGVGGVLALAVDPLFGLLPALIGGGLVFSGVTDTCGMAMVLAKLPYNRTAPCDVRTIVGALTTGRPAPGTGIHGWRAGGAVRRGLRRDAAESGRGVEHVRKHGTTDVVGAEPPLKMKRTPVELPRARPDRPL